MPGERPGRSGVPHKARDSARFPGMRAFYLLWFGQFVSIFASRMTNFAITLWAWDLTGQATALVLVGVASFFPGALLSPFIGTLVDRWNRKLVLALSDFASALGSLFLLILFALDRAQIWHLYAVGIFGGIFGAFQYPAYASVITTMVPKEQYARANSMRSVISSASGIAAPLLAGAVIGIISIKGILIIDLVTFVLALGILWFITIPQPAASEEGREGKGTIWKETAYGFKYIFKRESLLAIMLLFTVSNISAAFGYPMMTPMILSKTGDSAVILGSVNSISSAGFLAGSLLMTVWGGPKQRIHGVNASFILWGLLGAFVFGAGWTLPIWLIGGFLISIFNPVINSCYIAIMQSKIAQDVQGRFFGVENMITTLSFPVGQVFAGLLSDNVFEPGLQPGGYLVDAVGGMTGVGPGAGYGFSIMLSGVLSILVGIAGYMIKAIREIETILPDIEADIPPEGHGDKKEEK
ncbi:MAG: MFS transporter [Anaerolineales bacterium]|nr:MFS transporter [Anaerolineales bacterium]